MRIFRPFAITSSVSILGMVFPDTISLIVDFGIPVIIESWRIDKFLLYIILSSNIFIAVLFYYLLCKKTTGKYWKWYNRYGVYIKGWLP